MVIGSPSFNSYFYAILFAVLLLFGSKKEEPVKEISEYPAEIDQLVKTNCTII